ncbi:MAG: hypothetical protein JWQ04_3519 [Pedosphaera sp.]|nr:hypothetical protein [Pedosphaera sp.]
MAFLLSGLVLFVSLLSASPAVHKFLHPDADAPGHQCSVTLFAKGLVAAPDVAPIFVGAVILFGGIALLAESFVFLLADYRFSRGRAPPVSRLG